MAEHKHETPPHKHVDKAADADEAPAKVAASPKPAAAAATADPDAPRERGDATPVRGRVVTPGARELEKLREERFGKGGGAIHIDADGDKTYLVYVNPDGTEAGRERYRPEDKAK